jgi:hypothetical protein
MFNQFAYSAIDSIQDGKKQFINTFVQHTGIKNALNEFVDSQTKYTKSAVDSSLQTATSLGMILTSQKFFNELTDSFKNFSPTKK